MEATPTAPPSVVEAHPGPGLATITDRRDGTTRRWSRSLWQGTGIHGRVQGRTCANCGGALRGGFYKPPPVMPPIRERLCLACVAGDAARRP